MGSFLNSHGCTTTYRFSTIRKVLQKFLIINQIPHYIFLQVLMHRWQYKGLSTSLQPNNYSYQECTTFLHALHWATSFSHISYLHMIHTISLESTSAVDVCNGIDPPISISLTHIILGGTSVNLWYYIDCIARARISITDQCTASWVIGPNILLISYLNIIYLNTKSDQLYLDAFSFFNSQN